MYSRRSAVGLTFALLACMACGQPAPDDVPGPLPPIHPQVDLAVLIVVDQLPQSRWDLFRSRFGDDGFRRLIEAGREFDQAGFDHGTTFTAVGHAALVTGVLPGRHGIVANEWCDRETGARTYSVGSRRSPSPETLLYPTVGDRLIELTSGRARVWSVSLKDRSAVLMAGAKGTAVWWDKERGAMTMRHPRNASAPVWLTRWLAPRNFDDWIGAEWKLLFPPESYVEYCADDSCIDAATAVLEHAPDAGTFPKSLDVSRSRLGRAIRSTPHADRLTTDLAIELLRKERLGANATGAPDFLAISYSATDYVGHRYGPDSVEYEDQLLQLDRLIAELLEEIDRQVGLDRTTIVLTSDHGTDSATGYHRIHGRETGRLIGKKFVPRLNRQLRQRLSISENLVKEFFPPGLFFDREAVDTAGVTLERASVEAATLLMDYPEMGAVYRSTPDGPVSHDAKARDYDGAIENGFYFPRSGDLILVPKFRVYAGRDGSDGAMHGTPHPYDTEVPIVVVGPGIVPGEDSRRVTPRQIAETLTEALGLPQDPMAAPALPRHE